MSSRGSIQGRDIPICRDEQEFCITDIDYSSKKKTQSLSVNRYPFYGVTANPSDFKKLKITLKYQSQFSITLNRWLKGKDANFTADNKSQKIN